jgi:hypothetical protein
MPDGPCALHICRTAEKEGGSEGSGGGEWGGMGLGMAWVVVDFSTATGTPCVHLQTDQLC